MKKTLAAALLVSSASLTACDMLPPTACNAMYAPDMVTIHFDDVAFSEGTWRLEVDDLSCSFDLPMEPSGTIECDEAMDFWMVADDDGTGLAEVNVWEFAPETFEVALYLDDELYDAQSFSPDYDVDEPNGRGCGERSSASVDFQGSS